MRFKHLWEFPVPLAHFEISSSGYSNFFGGKGQDESEVGDDESGKDGDHASHDDDGEVDAVRCETVFDSDCPNSRQKWKP